MMSQQSSNHNNSNAESILTPMEEVLDAWEEEDFESCGQKCLFLLKKRKGVMDASLTESVQKILLQCWLQLEQYSKVEEWTQANNSNNSNSNSNNKGCKGLALYAHYRSGDYDKVSKSASATKDTLLEQHLLAQSYFHLNQPTPALKVYGEIMANDEDKDEDEDEDAQTRMEALSNALAVLASMAVPFVPVVVSDTNGNYWVGRSEAFLNEHAEFSDLAHNLGILQYLGSPPNDPSAPNNNKTNWLEHAEDHADPEDLPSIETNLAWSNHFWYKDLDEVAYSHHTTNTNNNNTNNNNTDSNTNSGSSSAQAAVATLNQSLLLLDEQQTKKKNTMTTFPTQPHPKWNLLQLRMYWYNRAVAQYKEGKMVECQESCQSLKKTLDYSKQQQQQHNNKNKKKQSTAESASLWWDARAEVLVAHAQDKQSKTSQAISKLEQKLEFLRGQPSSPIMDHAVAHVQLHLYLLQNPSTSSSGSNNSNKKQIKTLLTSLPESIRSSEAVQATLNAIGGSNDYSSQQQQQSKSSSSKKSPEEQALTLFGQGQYKEAAALYQQTLPAPSKSDPDQLTHHLWRVQALACSDQHEEANRLWDEVQARLRNDANAVVEDAAMDGEALEQKALPRGATTKIIGAESSSSSSTKQPKLSKESVLRRRTKKREAYLKQLEAKGEYNPDRPTKPNAERWIPKHERSRARGRRGRGHQQSRSAQGGGSQADAQRLDAAARRAGTIPASSGPSTANMKVTAMGGGKRRGRH
jgi:hypothetical protein